MMEAPTFARLASPSTTAGFIPPFKVHLCWFGEADPRRARVAHALYAVLHRPLDDNAVRRPGIEIPVELGRSLPGLLDALNQDREPAAGARLVIVLLDAEAFARQADRDVVRRALRRWMEPRAGEVFVAIILGGVWHTELRGLRDDDVITVERAADHEVDLCALGIDVCLAAGRALRPRAGAGDPARPRILLSYARADGHDLTRALAAQFRARARVETWNDESRRPTGAALADQLQHANGDAVVLIVRTDHYSDNPECAFELLAAKQSRAPIVTLLATVDGENETSAYSGNHRTMTWRAGRELEVVARCVQAWLHGHHFRATAAAALTLAGLPADSDILPRRPELLDFVGIDRTGRRLVVHPDPPLTDGEATVLRTAHPAVRIATPTTLLGRVLLAQDPEPPLTGTTLAFSLSVAQDLPTLREPRVGAGMTQDHVNDVVYSIVLATLRSGARIAYGGDFREDRGYGRFLVELHRSYGGLGTRGSAQLICFLENGARSGAELGDFEFDPIDVDVPPGAAAFPALHAVLWGLAMREAMASRCAGRILLGGKASPATPASDGGYTGVWPGFLEEAWRTLRHDRALYVLGGFGGAAGLIATMLMTGKIPPELSRSHHAGAPVASLAAQVDIARAALAQAGTPPEILLEAEPGRYADLEDLAGLVLDRWRRFEAGDREAWCNGLDLAQNRRLFRATDRTEISHLVFEGLRRRGQHADAALQLAVYLGDIASVPKVDGYAVTVTPGVPRVGASAALESHVARTRGMSAAPTMPVALERVTTSDLAGSHVLVAQLELPPIGQPVDVASIARVAEDVAREANRVGIESIACAVFGATIGFEVGTSVRAMVEGMGRGRGRHPSKLVFCELDRARYEAIRAALPPEAIELRAGAMRPADVGGPVLHVDVDDHEANHPARIRVTLYVPDLASPVAPLHEVLLAPDRLDELRRRVAQFDDAVRVGRALWRELLSPEIHDHLARHRERAVIVLGDHVASTLPWELLLEDRDGAVPHAGGVVRRIALRGPYRRAAHQLEPSRLRVLVIADPCGDLPNAMLEADAVCAALGGRADVIVERIDRGAASLAHVKSRLERGAHDVVHVAGHAHFDDQAPERSGLILADGTLAAAELPAISPQLVFLSACESGRLRDIDPAPTRRRPMHGSGRPLAEAFLRAGVRAFVGTFYAVLDLNARDFASIVHAQLAAGQSLGVAMRAARADLYARQAADWGNFMLYGDDGLIL